MKPTTTSLIAASTVTGAALYYRTKTTSTKMSFEKRELFGKTVEIQIPSEVFPTSEDMKKMDDLTGPNCQHGWYETTSLGETVNLHYRYWLPKGKLKGVLIFTMGIQSETSHALNIDGRPLDMALVVDTFLKKGVAVYAKDQLGHGLSEGVRFYIPSWEEARDDSVGFAKMVAGQHPADIPLMLGGESFGGCLTILTAKYFQDHPEESPQNFDSSILICPAIVGDIPPFPVYQILRYALAPIFPTRTPFFMPDTVSPERIWRDKLVQDLYCDPKKEAMGLGAVGKKFRLGTAVGLLLAMEEAKSYIPDYKMPFCVVHGDDDIAVPIVGSQELFEKSATPSDEKEFHTITDSTHGILCDPKAEEAMKCLSDFCDARMKKFGN